MSTEAGNFILLSNLKILLSCFYCFQWLFSLGWFLNFLFMIGFDIYNLVTMCLGRYRLYFLLSFIDWFYTFKFISLNFQFLFDNSNIFSILYLFLFIALSPNSGHVLLILACRKYFFAYQMSKRFLLFWRLSKNIYIKLNVKVFFWFWSLAHEDTLDSTRVY